MKNKKGITLIALVITIIVLIILAGVAIYLSLGNNGILNKAEQAKNETTKQAATEKMNLKITNMQIETYGKEQRMPTLQEFSDGLCEDNEIEYVELQSKKVGSLNKIEVGEAESIFTKLKEYPYEFEINSSLQLASIDGVVTESNNNSVIKNLLNEEKIYSMATSWTTIGDTIILNDSIENYDMLYFKFSCLHNTESEYGRSGEENILVKTITYNNSTTRDIKSEIILSKAFIVGGNTAQLYQLTGWFKNEKTFYVNLTGCTYSLFTKYKLENIYGVRY